MPHGGTACGIIAQPGSLNIQPRLDGANAAILAAGKGLKILHTAGFDSGASESQETTSIPEFIQANGPKLHGVFAVDGGSTALLGPALAKYSLVGKVSSGGFDLEPATLAALKAGQLGFTIDQSPYLQGFLPYSVPVHVQALRRPGLPARDRHRPEVRDQGQRRPLHVAHIEVRGLDHRREALKRSGAIPA